MLALVKSSIRVLLLLCLAVLPAAGVVAVPASAAAPAAGPGLTLSATPPSVRFGEPVRFSARLAAPGAQLQLSARTAGQSDFAPLRTLVADLAGTVSWRETPAVSAAYRVEYAGDDVWAAASAETSVTVRAKVSLRASGGARVYTGERVTVTVSVAPLRHGGAVDLQEWDERSRTWQLLATLTLDESSRARWAWRPEQTGRHKLRARVAADATTPVSVSGVKSVRVYDPSDPYGVPDSYPHLILVDLSQYKLYYYEHGRVTRVFKCVLGRPSLPTPRGRFRIYAKDPHMYGAYGPRRLRYLGAYAVHGTNEPWLLDRWPRNYSHGCTRLANTNILWLYDRVHVGTPVWNVP